MSAEQYVRESVIKSGRVWIVKSSSYELSGIE
jgi:hypothetical protein